VDAPALRRVESHFKGADGLRLFRRAWLPERPARVLALVHGYAEHSGRYDAFARWFAARGAAVHAYDHRGHGRSAGTRTHVDRFGSFLDDLERFLELVRAEHPEGPLTLVGHSMGGLVTAAFLVERAPAPSSAVLSGPALALGPGVSRLRVAAARALRRVAPRLALGSGLDPHGLSRDPAVVRGYLEDPHVHRTMTASLAAELLEAIPRTAGAASRVAVPLLVLHGEEDPMCPVEGSRAFFAGVECAGSRLTTYPGLRHEIFNEPEQEQVFADLWRWLEELSA
jgi:alpha-beta hydrolase superfamily lysophospholipase